MADVAHLTLYFVLFLCMFVPTELLFQLYSFNSSVPTVLTRVFQLFLTDCRSRCFNCFKSSSFCLKKTFFLIACNLPYKFYPTGIFSFLLYFRCLFCIPNFTQDFPDSPRMSPPTSTFLFSSLLPHLSLIGR